MSWLVSFVCCCCCCFGADDLVCGCAEFDVPGEGYEFGVGDAEGGVCAACGAAEGAGFVCEAASGDFGSDEGECGAAGGAAVGAAVVAGRFSHGRFR